MFSIDMAGSSTTLKSIMQGAEIAAMETLDDIPKDELIPYTSESLASDVVSDTDMYERCVISASLGVLVSTVLFSVICYKCLCFTYTRR